MNFTIDLLLALLIGFVLGVFLYRWFSQKNSVPLQEHLQLQSSRLLWEEKYKEILQQLEKKETVYSAELEKSRILSQNVSYKNAELYALKERLQEKDKFLSDIQVTFSQQFESIANRVLLENSGNLTRQTSETLTHLLQPLSEKLQRFGVKVDENREKQLQETVSLKAQIAQLEKLNQNLSLEAKNLSSALKGNSKVRGIWGEVVLEKLLEKSGLAKGIHYETQVSSYSIENPSRLQPDVIVHLPGHKNLIIDSKLSLLAYENFVAAESESDKEKYLKEHIRSVENHIKSLSNKNYVNLQQISSPDFVLMFLPIESSFHLVLQAKPDIYNFALEKNVVIVTASTFLATLRMVDNIWQQEKQNKNVQEIAKQSGMLYDKFVNFVGDLQKVGISIEEASKAHKQAMKRLSSGQGNLVSKAEKIRELGAKSSKQLSPDFLEE